MEQDSQMLGDAKRSLTDQKSLTGPFYATQSGSHEESQ